jgi:hypothetical protein
LARAGLRLLAAYWEQKSASVPVTEPTQYCEMMFCEFTEPEEMASLV